MFDEVNSDLEDDIDKLMDDSNTESVLEKSLRNELHSYSEPLYLLAPEAINHVVENPIIDKILEEFSNKPEKEVKGKIKEKEIKSGEIELDWEKMCSICK